MSKNIVITGASSGFGAMTARALADAGHTVYAGMRHPERSNAAAVEDLDAYAKEQSVNLHAVAMDVTEQDMVNAAIAQIIDETGRLDVEGYQKLSNTGFCGSLSNCY